MGLLHEFTRKALTDENFCLLKAQCVYKKGDCIPSQITQESFVYEMYWIIY